MSLTPNFPVLVPQVRVAFEKIDADMDGAIDRQKMAAMLEKVYVHKQEAARAQAKSEERRAQAMTY